MSQETYAVRVTKDQLVFSAAHFVTYNGNICERLHGHNFRVAVEVVGPLDENRYVFDFIALRDAVHAIVLQLDHRMLLPLHHSQIRVTETESEVEARFESRRWVFPREDCILLPIENTTVEQIACWIVGQLEHTLLSQKPHQLTQLQVEVEENFGQWGIYSKQL